MTSHHAAQARTVAGGPYVSSTDQGGPYFVGVPGSPRNSDRRCEQNR